MIAVLEAVSLVLIGLAGGIVVGGGLVALLVVLDIVPRLSQLARSAMRVRDFEAAIVTGVLFWTWADFFAWKIGLPSFVAVLFGALAGCFVGMLAAALTEVLNVLPITAKRLGLGSYMVWLLMAMAFGKIVGSLIDWLVFHAP